MACVCSRGLLTGKLNFPVADYSTYSDRLAATGIEDLAKQLRAKASAGAERGSLYKGIRWKKGAAGGGTWEVALKVGPRYVFLGDYEVEVEAAQVLLLFGLFCFVWLCDK